MAGATNHLDKELAEVYEELADCAIIAMQKAQLEPGDSGRVYLGSFLYTLGFCCTLLGGSLQEAIEKKMVKNMSRVWPKKPDADGVYHHESQ